MNIDEAMLAYATAMVRALAKQEQEESSLVQNFDNDNDENNNFLGSLVITLLFVPFSIYFGVVFFIFALECYQFFIVWNLVSRTRDQDQAHM